MENQQVISQWISDHYRHENKVPFDYLSLPGDIKKSLVEGDVPNCDWIFNVVSSGADKSAFVIEWGRVSLEAPISTSIIRMICKLNESGTEISYRWENFHHQHKESIKDKSDMKKIFQWLEHIWTLRSIQV